MRGGNEAKKKQDTRQQEKHEEQEGVDHLRGGTRKVGDEEVAKPLGVKAGCV